MSYIDDFNDIAKAMLDDEGYWNAVFDMQNMNVHRIVRALHTAARVVEPGFIERAAKRWLDDDPNMDLSTETDIATAIRRALTEDKP